jgi:D-alanyl-D-alanine carboxypeptidase
LNLDQAKKSIEEKFTKMVDSSDKIPSGYLLIHSDKHSIHWSMAHGQTESAAAHADQPYHTASIGKIFTAALIALLVQDGKIHYSDPISKYLSDELLDGLHIYKGIEYSKDITVEHLVSNTSGLPDFYEEKPKRGKPFLDIILVDPKRRWTGEETIEWTKQNLKARFKPGEKCHYTNTAYNLLGLIIENVTSKPYHEALHEYLFKPLHMKHSYLSQYSEPEEQSAYPVAHVFLKDRPINVEEHISFSSIYSGGQTVSTSEDLVTFLKALVEYQLLSKESLQKMMQWRKLWMGIDYGYGLMKIRMMPFTDKYNVWGGLGSLGSFMLYNPTYDLYIVGNFNSRGLVGKSVRFVFSVIRTIAKAINTKSDLNADATNKVKM